MRDAHGCSWVRASAFWTLTLLALPAGVAADTLPYRKLKLHGPVELAADNLGLTASSGADVSQSPPAWTPACSDNSGWLDGVGLQTPSATTRWAADARIGVMDPGIAVGTKHVMVNTRNHVALYDKAGALLGPKYQGQSFPNPFTVNSLFAHVTAGINAALDLPTGLPPGLDGTITGYFDARVMFDPFRKRFWIAALSQNKNVINTVRGTPCQTKENPVPSSSCAQAISQYPNLLKARRSHVAVAVSKTEDPRDGFYLYWWDAVIEDGTCDSLDGCTDILKRGFQGGDYPTIGMSENYMLVSVGVSYRDATIDVSTQEKAQKWIDCDPDTDCNEQNGYAYGALAPADAMANGFKPCLCSPPCDSCYPVMGGWAFGVYHKPVNGFTDESRHARGLRPALHYGNTIYGSVPAFVNNFVDTSVSPAVSRLVIRQMYLDGSAPAWLRTDVKVTPFTYSDNFGIVLNAVVRDDEVFATWHSRAVDTYYLTVARYDLASGKLLEQDIRGASCDDPQPYKVQQYRYPGVAVNGDGDVVAVFNRYSETLAPEARYSVSRDGQPFRPSRPLMPGGKYREYRNRDTVGIGVDAFDDTAVWMAQGYAAAQDSTPYRIMVGKVLGLQRGNLGIGVLQPADPWSFRAVARNHGDGPAGAAQALFFLSRDTRLDPDDLAVASASLPALEAGQEVTLEARPVIPPETPDGAYYVLARLTLLDPAEPEYALDDNVSPLLGTEPRLCISRDQPPAVCR